MDALGVDTRDMLLIHRVFRREFGQLPALVRAAAGDRPRVARLAAHITEMVDFLHTHHTGEDELLWPLLRSRARLSTELIDRMEAQHAEIDEAIHAVRRMLPRWATTADGPVGEQIADRLDTVAAVLTVHLAEEEGSVLPLASWHLSQIEWDALAEHGTAAVRPSRRLAILGHILEEADADEKAHFIRKVPAPARLAFALIGRRRHARETTAVRG